MAVQAIGKIKKYQIIISFLYLLNFVGSFCFLFYGYPPVSVFIVRIVVSVLILWTRVFLLNKMVNICLMHFFINVIIRSFLLYCLAILIVYLVNSLVDGFAGLCIVVVSSTLCTTLLVYLFGFEKSDRIILKQMFNVQLNKIFRK